MTAYFKIVVSLVFALAATAFRPSSKCKETALKMATGGNLNVENWPGVSAPFGYFDPLGLSVGKSEETMTKWREAELKHGRLAMLAAAGLLVQERFNPLFEGRILGAGIYHFQQVNSVFPSFWIVILVSIGIFEAYTITRAWEPYDATRTGIANMRKDYEPGME